MFLLLLVEFPFHSVQKFPLSGTLQLLTAALPVRGVFPTAPASARAVGPFLLPSGLFTVFCLFLLTLS